jgi:N-acetylglucosaminyldiphosphoundecaprenol N-acetyl-beta-D-mannosaminyltransferase
MDIPSYYLLGVRINPLAIPELNALIAEIINSNRHCIIANQNLHSIYIYHHDPKMQTFTTRAQYMHVDGMPIILLGRLLGYPLRRKHRVTYVDWIHPLMAEATRQGWRIFYLGSKPDVVEYGATILRQKFPGLQIMTADGYFDATAGSVANQKIIEKINVYQPDVLMVGMGMPRQEHWIVDNLECINANVILTCGACIDYIAGAIPTPPRWMGRMGLEWSYRLWSEPKRLWQRYLIEPWFVAKLFFQEIWTYYKPQTRIFSFGKSNAEDKSRVKSQKSKIKN